MNQREYIVFGREFVADGGDFNGLVVDFVAVIPYS
jgi:hypothetical protein